MKTFVFKKHGFTARPWHNWVVNPATGKRCGVRFGWLWFDIEAGNYGRVTVA